MTRDRNRPDGGPGLRPGLVVDRYIVLYGLGSVETGEQKLVAVAHDPELDRNVVLKLLTSAGESSSVRADILAAARALARVEDPNVVRVFDVGEFANTVYVAMERVAGPTLSEWLIQERRSWRQILTVFLAAGRGLAAGHGAGMVHGGFDTTNVLVPARGTAKVLNFGLSRARQRILASIGREIGGPASSSDVSQDRLDHRDVALADQYDFCCALSSALFPQPSADPEDLPADGRLRPPLHGRGMRIPERVRQAVRRGLSSEPGDRFDSMDALLAALSSTTRVPARAALAAACLVAPAFALLAPRWIAGGADPCGAAPQQLAGVWDRRARDTAQARFLGAGAPQARTEYHRVEQTLDAYAQSWAEARETACRAQRRQDEPSRRAFDLEMLCLDNALAAFGELAAALRPGHGLAAADGALALPDLSYCGDRLKLLRHGPTAPSAGAALAMEATSRALSVFPAGPATGQGFSPQQIEALLADVRAIEFPPYRSSLLRRLATRRVEMSELEEAEDHLLEALEASLEAGNQLQTAAVFAQLADVVGIARADFAAGRRWANLAAAAVSGVENSSAADEAEIFRLLARYWSTAGEPARSNRMSELALDRARLAFGEGSRRLVDFATSPEANPDQGPEANPGSKGLPARQDRASRAR